MRKLLLIPFSIVFLLVGLYLAFNGGVFNGRIERSLGAAAGGTASLGLARLELGWPLRLNLQGIQVSTSEMALNIKRVDIDFLSLGAPYLMRVKVSEPQISLEHAAPASEVSASSAVGAKRVEKPTPIQLELTVEKGIIKSKQAQITDLSLKFEQKLFLQTPAKVQAQGSLSTSYFPGSFPVSVNGDSFTLSGDAIKALDLKATLVGLQAKITGASLLAESRHRWSLTLQAADLSQVPTAAMEAFVRNLKGSVLVQAELIKNSAKEGWEADGLIKAESVAGGVSWGAPTYGIDGLIAGNLKCNFNYKSGKLHVTDLNGDVDLTDTRILVQDRLNKPIKTPTKLKFDVVVAGEKVNLKTFDFKFAQIEGRLVGGFQVGESWVSDLKLDIGNAKIAGLEKIIIPLRKSPLLGEVGVQMRYAGSLLDPWASQVFFDDLRLKEFSAQVDFEGPKFKIHGPLKADLDIRGEINRGEPKTLKVQGVVDLKAPALNLGALNKTVERDFLIKVKAVTVGDALTIENLDLATFFGAVQATGNVSSFAQPKINLKVASKNLSLNELRMSMAGYQDLIPKGTITGDLNLTGQYDGTKEWFNLPIRVTGDVSANIVDYRMGSALAEMEARVKPKGAPPPPQPPSSLLPKGFLTENLNLKTRVQIGLFTKDQLSVRRVSADGLVQAGKFKGLLSSQEIFGGVLEASGLEVPLFELKPLIRGMVAGKSVIIEQAIGYLKPNLKGFATGEVYGRADFSTLLPSEPDFMKELKMKGEVTLEPVVLNTVKVGQPINDVIKKLPVSLSPMKAEPLKGRVKIQFNLVDSQMDLPSVDGRDVDGSELKLKGKVSLVDFNGDLAGTFAWVNPTVKGCLLEGNSDGAGRMLVPLLIKGDLMSPSSVSVSEMTNKLAERALDCEKKKLLQNLPKDAKKALKGVLGK